MFRQHPQLATVLTLLITSGLGISTLSVCPSLGVEESFQEIVPEQDSSLLMAQADLTAVWNCNDGGIYFVRQVGNQIWWYGQSSDGGNTWSNVFQGTITGSQITGSWADVPKGSIRGYGWMTLEIQGGDRFVKIAGGENFGGSVWSR